MRTPEPVVLAAGPVRLEPLERRHTADLFGAAWDEELWRWLPAGRPETEADMLRLVDEAVDDAARFAFAVIVDGRAQGSTSYLDVDLSVAGLEIGWTWYARPLWASAVNPQCKRLLLTYAFDVLGAQRVTFKTDGLNLRSQSAIRRLGAAYDGTLRHARLRSDGSVRDNAYFSVLAAEWPSVRAGLDARLSAPRAAP